MTGGDRDLAWIGALVSDQARCRMLLALSDGRSLPASRLAAEAEVTPATASSHLRRLTEGGLLEVEVTGRRRNYRLATPEVGVLIEALERLAPTLPIRSLEQSQQVRAWRQARICYDHIAGVLGVDIFRAMVDRAHLVAVPHGRGQETNQPEYALSTDGWAFIESLGIDIRRKTPVRVHLDATEDGRHLGGGLGRALLFRLEELGWIQRQTNRRLRITTRGQAALLKEFGIELELTGVEQSAKSTR